MSVLGYFYNLTIKVAANAESLPAQNGDLSNQKLIL
jgi:hypothetical protein